MIIFFLLLVGIISVSMSTILWMELSITSNEVDWLEERLTKLEKDAVKITFTEEPKYFPKKPNPKQFDGVKSEVPFVKTRKRKPKTVKDWEDEIDLGGQE